LDSEVKNKVVSPESVIRNINTSNISMSLVKYWKNKMALMLEYNHRKGYQATLNNWLAYTKSENYGDLDFKQIDVDVLKGFENYFLKRGLKSTTAYTNLKRIRALFNSAIKEGILEVGDYIFKAYTMPRPNKAKKEKLTVEEIKLFRDMEYPEGSIIKTSQQSFMLAFNMAGARIADILTLEWTNIGNGRIEYRMSKTGALNSFKLTSQLNAIIAYFKSVKPERRYIVPMLEDNAVELGNEAFKKKISSKTAEINSNLKKIAEDAGITKKISTHISRHSFSSIAIKKSNGDVNFVKNALKHSTLAITQAYIDDLDTESLDEKMGNITDL
jgi:site-specific recombinase XerD